jgi:hypothetical protein
VHLVKDFGVYTLLIMVDSGNKTVDFNFLVTFLPFGNLTPIITLRLWETATRFTNPLQERN